MNDGASLHENWFYDSPVHSDVEAKLRNFLVKLRNDDRILGIQVCAYKDGEVIIDTAAGVLGKEDPRPVQPDSLFPLFSVSKGVVAGLVHWLADKGKLKLDENVANFWPEFGTNGKEQIKVNHILNHTSGLHNALADIFEEDPMIISDFDECLKRIAMVAPETEPGCEQFYHYLSYGWLCGGIIEHASGKKFQDVLEEAFVRPLQIDGELYIGIPPGVESRLATITVDTNEFTKASQNNDPNKVRGTATIKQPSTLTSSLLDILIPLINILDVRRAIIPATNLHASARALTRYYAALIDVDTKIFTNTKDKIHDAFVGSGDCKDLILQNGKIGLGFIRLEATEGGVLGFGHAGFGGSTGYADINNRFAISVTLNLASSGALTGEIIRFICSELNLPIPEDYAESRDFTENPKIN
ncbi:beta-lactamase/transpeptidase-like protein [Artemisia annua]|uniref:Beta-lactamase/transpeptidase-like protein n=1 Tax=Artemisia annua TaxID=35608 RepID=A0A2U1KEW8_ARTAN|nr:beta-lactamase/transpeptidase-like protein [Artemisia annua]